MMELNDYDVRHLEVFDLDTQKKHRVIHMNYTRWPDHGMPESAIPLLQVNSSTSLCPQSLLGAVKLVGDVSFVSVCKEHLVLMVWKIMSFYGSLFTHCYTSIDLTGLSWQPQRFLLYI